MRWWSLVLAGGCANGAADAPIRHVSTLEASTRGLVLHRDGGRGHAGMFDTNCPFETVHGRVTGDFQLPDSGETVEDGADGWFGPDSVVLVLGHTVQLLDKSSGDYVHEEVPWDGVEGARFTADGLVALADPGAGCEVQWWQDGGVTDTSSAPGCDPGRWDVFEAGSVVLGGDPIRIVTPDDTVSVDGSGRLVAVDDALDQFYVATEDQPDVAAYGSAGDPRWTTSLAGPIRGLAAAGAGGAAVVTWEREDGTGAVSWLDGTTGDLLQEIDTPSAAPALTVSADGRTLALVLPDAAYFYAVDLVGLRGR